MCVRECARVNVFCVYLTELLCACVLVHARAIVLFEFMPVCMRVYVGVRDWCVRVLACRHASVLRSGCAIV